MHDKLDRIDISILKILQKDSSQSHKQIGSMLNKSSTTIHERIQRLQKQNFIAGYVAILNPDKLDQKIHAIIYLKLSNYSEEVIETFKKEIIQIKEVRKCLYITGPYSIILKILTTDTNTLYQIERNIGGLKNVKALESYIVLDKIIDDSGFDF